MRFLDNQKEFDDQLNQIYDPTGKSALKEILEAMHYTNICLREKEMLDGDSSFWDVKGDKNGRTIYFDVSIKTPWKNGLSCPFLKEGIDIARRKSISHNPRHNKVDYYVEISNDCKGAFFVTKENFEKSPEVEKLCTNHITKEKYMDKVKRVQVDKGLLVVKKDNKWQIQS
jgi:hypothetical protein